MNVDFTAAAEVDLETIADYIASDDPARALSFLAELRSKYLDLAAWPSRFPLVDRYAASGVRWRVHGGYLIFYRVDADRILVLHIRHGARDYAIVLFPE